MKNLSNHWLLLFLAFFLLSSAKAQTNNQYKSTSVTTTKTVEQPVAHPVANSASKINPLLIGATIPEVKLKSTDGKDVNLLDLVKNKPSVLIFYRGSWCPYCNAHLSQLRLIESQLVEMGYQLIAISPDSPEKLQENIDKNKLNYLLLSDSSASAATNFGIAFRVDDPTVELYKKYNVDLEKISGENHHILPVPSVFIVGTDGVIKFQYVNPNYKTRLSSDVILAAAKDLAPKN